MTENELVVPGDTSLSAFTPAAGAPASLTPEQASEASQVKGSKYFPFMQLLQRLSKAVTDDDQKVGTWLVKTSGRDKDPKNLTDSFEAYIFAMRGKATFWDGENMQAEYETVNPHHDPDDPESKATIQTKDFVKLRDIAKAEAADKTVQMPPHKSGIEVLLFIPSLGGYVTYFANSAMATSAMITNIGPLLDNPVRFFSWEKENKYGKFFLPSAEILPQDEFIKWAGTSTIEDRDEALTLFNTPPIYNDDENVEGAVKVEDADGGRER